MTGGIVLCAGFGTRLRPVTDCVPKPAVPFLGRPMVWYALRAMKAAGIDHVAANVHHLSDLMTDCVRECCEDLGLVSPSVYHESGDILGTGGGARACMSLMPDAERFVIYHGDVLCSADLSAALREHERSGADVTLVVAPRSADSKLGYVGVRDGNVVRIRDWFAAGTDAGMPMDACCFTGIHIVERHVLEDITSDGYVCLVTEIYPKMFSSGRRIHAFRHDGFFADVGTPQTYIQAQRDILSVPERLPGAVLNLARPESARIVQPVSISDDVVCHQDCIIGPNVCLSHGAVVRPGEKISDCMRFGIHSLSLTSTIYLDLKESFRQTKMRFV